MKNWLRWAAMTAVFCFCVQTARAQTASVSGNLQDVGVSNITSSNTFVRFELRNYGSIFPTVGGTTSIGNPVKNFPVNTSGNFSGTVYRNDAITPAATFYRVCIWHNNQEFRCNNYQITTATWNIATATPMVAPAQLSVSSPSQTFGARSIIHTQASAATTWTITHNFNSNNVSVHCFNNASSPVEQPCTVTLTNVNTVTVGFTSATAGHAIVIDSSAASVDEVLVGSATGLCSNPAAAPNHLLFTPLAPNTSTITPATYDYIYVLRNENGPTLQSATRSVTIGTGQAFQPGWDINAGDYAFTTGCPKMQIFVKNPSDGKFYLQTPSKRKIKIGAISRTSNVVTAYTGVITTPIAASPTGAVRASNVVTITTSSAHRIGVGGTVIIAGVTDSSFNGTFTVATVPSTTTFTYAQVAGDTTSGSGTADGPKHGLVPGDSVTITGVTCAGGGGCTNTFNGTFELLDGSHDGANASSDPNNVLIWAQTGANESGDTGVGLAEDPNWDLGSSAAYAQSNYGNRGPIFNTPFVTSGTEPPTTNTASIPALQVSLNRSHSRLGTSDPDYFHGRKLKVRLPEKFAVTLTTPLVMYETAIEGVQPPQTQTGNNSPLITSAISDPKLATVMVMGPQVELHGLNVTNSSLAGHAMMAVGGAHSFNGLQFSKGYIGASSSASATGAALRLRATPIAFNWRFFDMNFNGGRWNVWSDRAILSDATIVNSRMNCGAATDSGAFRILGGPDAPERATADGDGISSSVWVLGRATVTESCRGIHAYMTNSRLVMQEGAQFADAATSVGTEAVLKYVAEWWSEGSSAGYGFDIYSGASADSANRANIAAGIKQVGRGITIRNFGAGVMPSGTSTGTSVFLDANNLGFSFYSYGSNPGGSPSCAINEAASGVTRIINAASGLHSLLCFNYGNIHDNTLASNHTISGLVNFRPSVTAAGAHEWSIGVGKNLTSFDFYKSPPSTVANLGLRFSWNSGFRFAQFQNDGATELVGFRSDTGANQINFCAPSSPSNSSINVACVHRTNQPIFGKRLHVSNATSLVTGDFGSLSAGWGTTATISAVISNSKDQNFEVSIASSGTGQGANPTLTFTFKDGTTTNAPLLVCQRNDTLATAGRFAQTTVSATAPVFTFVGTPVAGETYKMACTFVGN